MMVYTDLLCLMLDGWFDFKNPLVVWKGLSQSSLSGFWVVSQVQGCVSVDVS